MPKDYEYGFGPEASGLGQLISPLMPFRREVIEPYEERFIESADPSQVERVVTPGQYGDVELAMPQAVEAFLNFKGLARDPEARAALQEGIASTPEMIQMLADRFGISSRAALAGEQEVYDPATNQVVGAEESLLAAPMLTAPGTAASIAQSADVGGVALGIMGGSGAKGRFGDAVQKAQEMAAEGRTDRAIRNKTGVIVTEEAKPGVIIPIHGNKGLSVKPILERENIAAEIAKGFRQGKLEDFIEWENGFEAYPELKSKTVELWDKKAPIYEKAKELGDFFYNPTTDSFVLTEEFALRGLDSLKKVNFVKGLQGYISLKEGMVQPFSVDIDATTLSKEVIEAKKTADELAYKAGRFPSIRESAEIAQVIDPYHRFMNTSQGIGRERDKIASYFVNDPERRESYESNLELMYNPLASGTADPQRTYPLNFGQLQGDFSPSASVLPTYPSSLPEIVANLKQEKGTGSQMLGLIKSAGVKQEDLERMDLPSFLDDSKKYTKQEILDHMATISDDLSRPLSDEVLENFYSRNYILDTATPDGTYLSPLHMPQNSRAIAITTTQAFDQSPMSKSKGINLYHKGLPENTVVHMRLNERLVYDGEKPVSALYIDEIQSDIHQAAFGLMNDEDVLASYFLERGNSGQEWQELLKRSRQEAANQVRQDYVDAINTSSVTPERREYFLGKLDNFLSPPFRIPTIPGVTPEVMKPIRKKAQKALKSSIKNILEKEYDIDKSQIRDRVYSGGFDSTTVPDAPLKENWAQVAFRRAVKEAVDTGMDYVAFTTDAIESRKYGGTEFGFYDSILAGYARKFASRKEYKSKLTKGNVKLLPVEGDGPESSEPIWLMKITPEMEKAFASPEVKPYSNYAKGGGVETLAPRAKAMFNKPVDIRQGVGSYAKHIRRA